MSGFDFQKGKCVVLFKNHIPFTNQT